MMVEPEQRLSATLWSSMRLNGLRPVAAFRVLPSHTHACPELARVSNLVSFEPDKTKVFLGSRQLALEPGQSATPHGMDRDPDTDEVLERGKGTSVP